jgi:iron complex outermembrane receptor protein
VTLRTLRAGTALSLTLGAFLALPAIASAQTQDTGGTTVAPGAGEGPEIEEVIVTAQRREQRLQDVPIAITVVDAEALDRFSINSIEGVQTLVPTLTLRKGTTMANSAVVLRGIGTISFSLAAEPAVSTVVDGVVYARSGQAFNDLYDIQRIEVLRGPQGTLFGKNASAGALNIVTQGPGPEFGGDVTVSAFSDQEYRVRANVSIPVTDTFGARLSATYGYYDGNIRNLFTGEDVNGYERKGVRGVFEWRPSDRLDFRFIADYSETNDDCCAEVVGTAPTNAAVLANLGGATPRGDGTREVNQNLVSQTIGDTSGVSLQGNFDLGAHTFTAIIAQRNWKNRELRDGDFMAAGANYVGVFQLHDDGVQDFDQFSQEYRITSPTGGLLEYQVGLFFFNVDGSNTFTRQDITCTASTLPVDATGIRPCAQGASTFAFPSATSNSSVELDNRAVFGQLTVNVSPDLRLIAGARYTEDEVSFRHVRVNTVGSGGPGISPNPFPPPGNPGTGSTSEENFSGRLGVQYDLTDDVMAYATYAQGYKGPAFNVFFNMSLNDTLPIAAETADSYEVGLKSTLLDRRLVLNLAAFNAEYENFQANSFIVIAGSVVTSLTNAGSVRTRGAEADFVYKPSERLTFSGGVAFADATIVEFFCPPPGPGVPACSTREGERLPLAPKWKTSLAAEYFLPLANEPFDMFFNAQFSHTSDQFSSLGAFPAERIEGFNLLNANLGFVSKDERLRLTLMGRNLLDDSFAALITPGAQGGAFRYIIPRDADRYFGAALKVGF